MKNCRRHFEGVWGGSMGEGVYGGRVYGGRGYGGGHKKQKHRPKNQPMLLLKSVKVPCRLFSVK